MCFNKPEVCIECLVQPSVLVILMTTTEINGGANFYSIVKLTHSEKKFLSRLLIIEHWWSFEDICYALSVDMCPCRSGHYR